MQSNKSIGNDFERKFCEMLSDYGFWVHNLVANASGQPADVIAVKEHKAYLIDCKVCSRGGFTLSRIEDNQDLAMRLWDECGNGKGLFAMLIGTQVIMVSHADLVAQRNKGHSNVNNMELREIGIPLEKWVKKCK